MYRIQLLDILGRSGPVQWLYFMHASYCLLENNLPRLVLGIRIHTLSNLGNSSFGIPPKTNNLAHLPSRNILHYLLLLLILRKLPSVHVTVPLCHQHWYQIYPRPHLLSFELSVNRLSSLSFFHRAAGSKSATTFFVLQPILNDTFHVQLIHRPLSHTMTLLTAFPSFPFPVAKTQTHISLSHLPE